MATTLSLNLTCSSSPRISLPLRSSPTFSLYTSSSSLSIKPSISFPLITLKPLIATTKPRAQFIVVSALKSLSGSDPVNVDEEVAGKFPSESGVYAVYDRNDELQFIGITRNIAGSIVAHKKTVPELCCSVKFGVVDDPDRAALTQTWKSWMEEHIKVTGKVPPGNESGNNTWVRQPPKRKPDLRLTPGRHVQLTVPLEELIDKLVKENKVVAFIKGSRSAPMCGFSQRVIGILESEGVDYESVDVLDEEHNRGLRETLKKYSNWPTFPQIFVNGELLGGCDIISSMHEKGELAAVFKK